MTKLDRLAKWISQHVGEKFYTRAPATGDPRRYQDNRGNWKEYQIHGVAKEEAFIEHLKGYIDKTIGLDLPQVEFSNDYKYFKIY